MPRSVLRQVDHGPTRSLLVPAQAIVGEFLKTFAEFPIRQKPASFSLDDVMAQAEQAQKKLEAVGNN